MIENNRPLVLNKNKKFVPLDGLNPNEIPNDEKNRRIKTKIQNFFK